MPQAGFGSEVGLALGLLVGLNVGPAVGCGDGLVVGAEVGSVVGSGDGLLVGLIVGCGEGGEVGDKVGSLVASVQQEASSPDCRIAHSPSLIKTNCSCTARSPHVSTPKTGAGSN